MAKLLKSLLKSDAVRNAACAVAAWYTRFVHLTTRWQEVDKAKVDGLWEAEEPFIVAHWHGRIMMLAFAWRRKKPIRMLISKHRDGELIAKTVAHLGVGSVRGSSSRDGASALRAMVKTIKQGDCVGITPDGPRGPRMRASDGVVTLARLCDVPIIPLSYATSRRRVLGSWDRFTVALPFSRGVFIWGAPILAPRHAGPEELDRVRQAVEAELLSITAKADRLCQVEVIEPACQTGDAG
jgi:lysophospholipid acyltransferase (LPLAT)-like uncharacterized protein